METNTPRRMGRELWNFRETSARIRDQHVSLYTPIDSGWPSSHSRCICMVHLFQLETVLHRSDVRRGARFIAG